MKTYNIDQTLQLLSFKVMKIFDDCKHTQTIDHKENQYRDIVTNLDLIIDSELKNSLKKINPNIIYKSEESDFNLKDFNKIKKLLLVDPLDGSKNIETNLPFNQTMISYLEKGVVLNSAIINPNNRELLYYSKKLGTSSNKIVQKNNFTGPVYLAYGSTFSDNQFLTGIIEVINALSAGVYRWGSAGSGLMELYKGNLKGFVGKSIKIWDAISYIPIFEDLETFIYHKTYEDKLDLIISYDEEIFQELKKYFHDK